MSIEVNGRILETDENGYLAHWDDWSAEVARCMARADDLELTESHWALIRFLRDYYCEHRSAPRVRILVREMGRTLGKDKANTRFLYRLFPDGPAKQACRYAGLPKPTGCI
jgi:TusE/DsrC/DsvC family sulfur relay protein